MEKKNLGAYKNYENALLKEMSRHVGRARVVGMGELFEKVFGSSAVHRINGTRALRAIITRLRRQGLPICSQSRTAGGGYYLAAAGSELEDYCKRLRKKALKGLCIEALLRQTTLPELLGQIILSVTHDVDISCRA
jgi:hypothetical protein